MSGRIISLMFFSILSSFTLTNNIFSITTESGFIRDWLLVGPFKFQDDEIKTELDTIMKTDYLESSYEAKILEGERIHGKIWTKYHSPSNLIDFYKLYQGEKLKDSVYYAVEGVNLDNSVYYLATNIYFEKETKNMKLYIGSDDYIVVYLNGKPVHFYCEKRRWILPEVDMVEKISFSKGWNQLVVKIVNISGGYSFFLCITDDKDNVWGKYEISLDEQIKYNLEINRITPSLAKGTGKGTNIHHWPGLIKSNKKNPEKVNIRINRDKILNSNFKGVGAQGDLFLWYGGANYKTTPDEIKTITERVKKTDMSITRLFLMTKWWYKGNNNYEWENKEMNNLYNVLELFKSMNTDVILTVWRIQQEINPGNNIENAEIIAECVSKLIKHLIEIKKYDNVKYLMIYNEPDLEFGKSVDEYKKIYLKLDEYLKKENVRDKIYLTGPDEALSFEWFKETTEKMDSLIDVYDSHHYEGYDALDANDWIDERIIHLKSKNINKPWLITEFGLWAYEPFYCGIFLTEYVINAINRGASGLLKWTMQSNYYPGEGGYNDSGMWECKQFNWKIRPHYYGYTVLTRNLKLGMKVIEALSDAENVLVTALKKDNDKAVIVISNRSDTTEIEISGVPKERKNFNKYVYNKKVLKFKDDKLIEPIKIQSDKDGKIIDKLEELSFHVYVEE